MSKAEIALQLVKEYQEKKRTHKREFFQPYQWQLDFYRAGVGNKQRLLMAANRVGKTMSAAYELACHLTGDYPDWWEGHRFNYPINALMMGVTNDQIRDVTQKELLGEILDREFTGGMVHQSEIYQYTSAVGAPGLAKDVSVRHKNGGFSKVNIRSYSQGQQVIMGQTYDFFLIDEEPIDSKIYPQALTRTATGNKGKGGYGVMTFTPENGMTELVTQFMEDIKPGQYLQNATWDDALHLTEETKEQLLQAYPEYQRKMRTLGIPALGEGMVFPIAEESISCDSFEIPSHFKRLAAIDFGIDHPTSAVWTAYDADRDIIYVYDCYKKEGEVPAIHAAQIKSKGAHIPLVYPHDGDNREKGSGETLADMYRQHGVAVIKKFDNPDGTNYVEPGLMEMLERMRTGRLKVFSDLKPWFDEFRRYHRKNGKIVKTFDDLMDATRYSAISVTRYGKQGNSNEQQINLYTQVI
jgi:phage terminase large subunit-like protein